ncbi:hypothetical protein SLEP1_g58001 [Rubroshorea leprosula]|uniref:Uncharacterized protein n=1 Tax=Rubroshorea leprosula TaxID=152421 RepID=A0AAV5MR67_9ROSI|nr:hypothetical protein SLEP1_g58001 [Rubroshorea leprosula]
MVLDCEFDKFRALCICGTLSRVHGICRASNSSFGA